MKDKSLTTITLLNGFSIEIKGMPLDKYEELIHLKDISSNEKIQISGLGYFAPRDISKIERRKDASLK